MKLKMIFVFMLLLLSPIYAETQKLYCLNCGQPVNVIAQSVTNSYTYNNYTFTSFPAENITVGQFGRHFGNGSFIFPEQLNVTGLLYAKGNIHLDMICSAGLVLSNNGTGILQCVNVSGGGNATASGATGYIPKFYNDTHLINSPIFTDNTSIGIGTTNPASTLTVNSSASGLGVINASNGASALSVNSATGRILMGTTNNPYGRLQIVGAGEDGIVWDYNLNAYRNSIANAFSAGNPSGNTITFKVSNGTGYNQTTVMVLQGNGNVFVNGTLNVTNITLANNCADGQILKWASGVGTCGADSGGTDGGGNATASGKAGFYSYFFNATHLLANGISHNGSTLFVNYPYANFTGTVMIQGVNLSARQSADNSTLTNRINADNNTQGTLITANNNTLTNVLGQKINLTGGGLITGNLNTTGNLSVNGNNTAFIKFYEGTTCKKRMGWNGSRFVISGC